MAAPRIPRGHVMSLGALDIRRITRKLLLLSEELAHARGFPSSPVPVDDTLDEEDELKDEDAGSDQPDFGAVALLLPGEDAKVIQGHSLDKKALVVDQPQDDDNSDRSSDSSLSSSAASTCLSDVTLIDAADWDSDKWYYGLCAKFDKLKIRQEYELMLDLKTQDDEKKVERAAVMEKINQLDEVRTTNTDMFKTAQGEFDKEIEDAQVTMFSSMSNFSNTLHDAVEKIEHTRRKKGLGFDMSGAKADKKKTLWADLEGGDEHATVAVESSKTSQAGELLRLVSQQQGQITALKTTSVLSEKRLAAHQTALDHVKHMQTPEGRNAEASEEVQALLMEVAAKRHQSKGSKRRVPFGRMPTNPESDAGPESMGAAGNKETKDLMKDIVAFKKLIKGVQEDMQALGGGKKGDKGARLASEKGSRRQAAKRLIAANDAMDNPRARAKNDGKPAVDDPAAIAAYFSKMTAKIALAESQLKKALDEKLLFTRSIERAQRFLSKLPEEPYRSEGNIEGNYGSESNTKAPPLRRTNTTMAFENTKAVWETLVESVQVAIGEPTFNFEKEGQSMVEKQTSEISRLRTELRALMQSQTENSAAPAEASTGQVAVPQANRDKKKKDKKSGKAKKKGGATEATSGASVRLEDSEPPLAEQQPDNSGIRDKMPSGFGLAAQTEDAAEPVVDAREMLDRLRKQRESAADASASGVSTQSAPVADANIPAVYSNPLLDKLKAEFPIPAASPQPSALKQGEASGNPKRASRVGFQEDESRGALEQGGLVRNPKRKKSSGLRKQGESSGNLDPEEAKKQADIQEAIRIKEKEERAAAIIKQNAENEERNRKQAESVKHLLQVQNENLQIQEQIKAYSTMTSKAGRQGELSAKQVDTLAQLHTTHGSDSQMDEAEAKLSLLRSSAKKMTKSLTTKRQVYKDEMDLSKALEKVAHAADPQQALERLTPKQAKLVIKVQNEHAEKALETLETEESESVALKRFNSVGEMLRPTSAAKPDEQGADMAATLAKLQAYRDSTRGTV